MLLVPAFFLLGNYNFFLLTCQAQQKTIWVAWSESVRACLNIGLPLILYFIFGKIYAFEILVFSLTAAHLLPLLLFAHKVRPPGQDNPGQEGKDITAKAIRQQVLQYGIPVAFFLSFSLALSVNDRYLIAKFIDYDTAGKYASLYDIINRSVTVG